MHFDDALQHLDAHYQAMPPVAVMQVHVAGYDGTTLRLHAPLARHVNDKGCAFGGSMISMMTLASWGLVWLRLQEAGMDADVFVADSEVRYLAPLFADIEVSSTLAGDGGWHVFLATLRERGRARATLSATVALPGGGVAAQCSARYVAIARR
jgi:thioesterase domain-containing protein